MKAVEPCQPLTWDSEFFGRSIARVKGHRLSEDRVREILKWCRTHQVECLYFLADTNHGETTRLALAYGFNLVDVRISLGCKVERGLEIAREDHSQTAIVRSWQPEDVSILQAIARISYLDSRFFFDPFFPKSSCEGLYETWIQRSCHGCADEVLVAAIEGQPVGYVSCHVLDDRVSGRIGLLGVAEQARGRGVGRLLVGCSISWFHREGVEVVRVVTQGRNVVAQRLYQTSGFSTHSVRLWYHRWMDETDESQSNRVL